MHTAAHRLAAALRIERTGVPIYLQLREQVLSAMASGDLRPGDQMPTLRQLAVALKVDINTVRRTYDELERLGAVQLIHGRGSFVADPYAAEPHPEALTQTLALARRTLAAARAGGVEPVALVARILELARSGESRTGVTTDASTRASPGGQTSAQTQEIP